MQGDGDFASEECIKLLKESDIVVTNPPFSKFRPFLKQLMRYDKKFLIVGDMNVITYKDVFPLIKENLIWSGLTRVKELETPGNSAGKSYFCQKREKWFQKFGKVGWYTNLPHHRRNEELVLYRTYSPENYPNYDNYDAINVDWVKDIPKDWDGTMGVPISFLDKYNPNQFEIIKFRKGDDGKDLRINGECPYFRILIKNKNPEK